MGRLDPKQIRTILHEGICFKKLKVFKTSLKRNTKEKHFCFIFEKSIHQKWLNAIFGKPEEKITSQF